MLKDKCKQMMGTDTRGCFRRNETGRKIRMMNEADKLGDLDLSQSIGAQLYRMLRGAIIRGELKPGQRVSEAAIAGQLDVSRQPVRETFIRLSDEGLLARIIQEAA
jgi:DNA-binding GntR family transcriptional regulator